MRARVFIFLPCLTSYLKVVNVTLDKVQSIVGVTGVDSVISGAFRSFVWKFTPCPNNF